MKAAPPLLKLGVIVGPHGVRGEVRVRSFTAVAEDVAAYGTLCDKNGQPLFALTLRGRSGPGLAAAIDGVTTREQAEALKGKELYVRRDALPEAEAGSWYTCDLIGLNALTPDGAALGTVTALEHFGAGEVLMLKQADGKETALPFTEEVVKRVDVAAGVMVVEPLEEI